MALRARCSGLILGLQRSSVINPSSFRLKYHHQSASHQIDEIGAHCHIYGQVLLSSRAIRPNSSSCSTMTSLAFVNSSWQKVIVAAILPACGESNEVRERRASLLR